MPFDNPWKDPVLHAHALQLRQGLVTQIQLSRQLMAAESARTLEKVQALPSESRRSIENFLAQLDQIVDDAQHRALGSFDNQLGILPEDIEEDPFAI